MKKRDVRVIISDGRQGSERLPSGELKETVLNYFQLIEAKLEEDFDLDFLEKISKFLTISVLEALNFKDLDLLQENLQTIELEIKKMK